jgi:hypothetical protein
VTKFEKATPVILKTHSELNEKWLQERLAEDPSLLGLGDLEVKDVERRQPRAGRLDLLLTDPEAQTRFAAEPRSTLVVKAPQGPHDINSRGGRPDRSNCGASSR